jgi:hypothetical protein
MVSHPVGNVGEATALVRCVELQIVEPSGTVSMRAAPLRFTGMDIWGDEDAFRSSDTSNITLNFESGRLSCPARILFDDLVSDFRAVHVSESIDECYLERCINAIAVVYLVDHPDNIAHADVVEANTCDIFKDLDCGCPFQAFSNYGFACSSKPANVKTQRA